MYRKHHLIRPAALALSLVMLGGTLPAQAASDLSGHWAEETVNRWLDAGRISGYPDDTFRPNQSMTRAEFATLLASVLPDGEPAAQSPFADVTAGQWYYAPVMKLLGQGVVASDTQFRPGAYITRQDAMTMAARAFQIAGQSPVSEWGFTDASQVSDYAVSAVGGFIENAYISGYPDGTLRPLAQITRAECVQMLDGLDVVTLPGSLEDIMAQVYAGVDAELPAVSNLRITDDTAEYYLGLPNLNDVQEAVASEAQISAIAHSVCLVRAKDGVDVEALMETIRTSVNPNKWICVGVDPEDVVVVNQGNLILLAMDSELSQQFADSFLALDLDEAGTQPEEPETPDQPNPPSEEETPEDPDSSEDTQLTPDENGLLQVDGYYMDSIGELRPDSITRFADKVDSLAAEYLQDANGIYYAIVPSKSYFVNDRLATPFDYQTMDSLLQENIQSAQRIDLNGALELTDYCQTDPHWKQENLQGVLDRLGEAMGFTADLSTFTSHTVDNFTGQHGYGKDNFPSETIHYLTNAAIDAATVDNYQKPDVTTVYDPAALDSDSPYDLFLSGPTPLLTITNPLADNGKNLVIFRDSFACSLAPLLVEQYETITLVDIRYMTSSLLPEYIDFAGKDVLFLYNEQVINHSEMLR